MQTLLGAQRNNGEKALDEFKIGGSVVRPGETSDISLDLGRLYDLTELRMLVRVLRGKLAGPTLFVSAAIHGDEIIGTEVLRRLLADKALRKLSGTLLAIPIVNVFGYNNKSRYLPDGRDLNRSFPGSAKGSLTARVAHLFCEQIVNQSNYGIDLHSATHHRVNLPHIRAYLDDPETQMLAAEFGVPVIINSSFRDGSLRQVAVDSGIKMLLFEGGEGLRYDEGVIRAGVQGIKRVMRKIGMLPPSASRKPVPKAFQARNSFWVRAPHAGSLLSAVGLGQTVEQAQTIAEVGDAFGYHRATVEAPRAGIIIGMNKLPLVNRGDALFHIATFEDIDGANEAVDEWQDLFDPS